MRGHGLVLHREMARVQRDAQKETSTTGRRATPATHCPRLPNAHPPDRRGAPRSRGRTRQPGACCRWGPRQGPRLHFCTYEPSWSRASPRRAGGHPWRSSRCRPHLARGSRPLTEVCRTMRTSTPRRRDCGRSPPPRATSSSGADVPDPAGSHGTGADVFAREPRTGRRDQHPVLPVVSQATVARQRHDGASGRLPRKRSHRRRAMTAGSCLVPLHA